MFATPAATAGATAPMDYRRKKSRSRSRSRSRKPNSQALCVGRRLRSGANKTLPAASRACARSKSKSRSRSRSRSRTRSGRRRSRRSRSRSQVAKQRRRRSNGRFLYQAAAPTAGAAGSSWSNYVRDYSQQHGMSYGDALKAAAPSWREQQGSQ